MSLEKVCSQQPLAAVSPQTEKCRRKIEKQIREQMEQIPALLDPSKESMLKSIASRSAKWIESGKESMALFANNKETAKVSRVVRERMNQLMQKPNA